MLPTLSIRAYTKKLNSHSHDDYHQLVLPVQGNINIQMDNFSGKVTVGECVVIPAGATHGFQADEAARFIVADMPTLPDHLLESDVHVFSTTTPLLSFIYFVEKQLQHQVDKAIESSILDVFTMLLTQQPITSKIDPRIRAAQSEIFDNLANPLSIAELSKVACLSPTQFKVLFKTNLGMSVQQYVTHHRMEKAKALLTHTDLPVQIVAERVGYNDLSAFSRRFSLHFGLPPRQFTRN